MNQHCHGNARGARARRGRRQGSLFSKLSTVLELRLIVDQLDESDALAFALTSRDFRAATCLTGSATARFGEHGIRTSVADSWASVARLRWAVCPWNKAEVLDALETSNEMTASENRKSLERGSLISPQPRLG